MVTEDESTADGNDRPAGSRGVKRGAFPTPKSEWEAAERYVPDDEAVDGPPRRPESPPAEN